MHLYRNENKCKFDFVKMISSIIEIQFHQNITYLLNKETFKKWSYFKQMIPALFS